MPACICVWEIYQCRRAGWLMAAGMRLDELDQFFRELAVIRFQVVDLHGQAVVN